MPDLTVIDHYACASHVGPKTADVGGYRQGSLFSEDQYPACSCPAYRFGTHQRRWRGRAVPDVCKHIRAAEEAACWWEGYEQPEGGRCPNCKGPVVAVRVR